MAKRKFVVVDRDIVCESRFSREELHKKFIARTTERMVIYQNFSDGGESSLSLAITEDGVVLIERDGYVDEAYPDPRTWDYLLRAYKRAENDLRVSQKIRKIFEATREFGSKSKPPSPFSGLLNRRDD